MKYFVKSVVEFSQQNVKFYFQKRLYEKLFWNRKENIANKKSNKVVLDESFCVMMKNKQNL